VHAITSYSFQHPQGLPPAPSISPQGCPGLWVGSCTPPWLQQVREQGKKKLRLLLEQKVARVLQLPLVLGKTFQFWTAT